MGGHTEELDVRVFHVLCVAQPCRLPRCTHKPGASGMARKTSRRKEGGWVAEKVSRGERTDIVGKDDGAHGGLAGITPPHEEHLPRAAREINFPAGGLGARLLESGAGGGGTFFHWLCIVKGGLLAMEYDSRTNWRRREQERKSGRGEEEPVA